MTRRFVGRPTATVTTNEGTTDIQLLEGPLFDRNWFSHFIGFDSIFDLFEKEMSRTSDGYPPYNLYKEDNKYVIEMAVAGFEKDEISIVVEDDLLKVSGEQKEEKSQAKDGEYLIRHIASRSFKRSFRVSMDHTKVSSASLENGMLRIELEEIVPENKKSKRIDIK